MSFLSKVIARYVLAESANESPIVEFHPAEKGSRSSHEIWVTFPAGTKYVYAVDASYEKHGKTWEQLERYLIGRESRRISKDGKEWKKEGDIWLVATASIKIYRGESSSSENRGKGGIGYWSTDPDFAVQFTQTGQMKEVMVREVNLSHIYDVTKEGKKLPSANSESDFDNAIKIAKEKGFYGVRFSEGGNQPDSFYIFNKKIF